MSKRASVTGLVMVILSQLWLIWNAIPAARTRSSAHWWSLALPAGVMVLSAYMTDSRRSLARGASVASLTSIGIAGLSAWLLRDQHAWRPFSSVFPSDSVLDVSIYTEELAAASVVWLLAFGTGWVHADIPAIVAAGASGVSLASALILMRPEDNTLIGVTYAAHCGGCLALSAIGVGLARAWGETNTDRPSNGGSKRHG